MYAVTQGYIDAVRAPTRAERLEGVLTYADGEILLLNEVTLGQNSVKISHACIEGGEIQFGSAISSELQIFVRSNESRYRFYDAKIQLTYGIQTADGGWVDIPLGVFHVAEPERRQSLVQLTAYDNLMFLDKDYGDTSIYGTPFEIMTAICEECGATFGMTEKEVLALPNGNQALQIDSNSGVSTYRGAAKLLGQLLACFVVADRRGCIIFRRYGKKPVCSLEKTHRYSLSAADYHCRYVGVVIKSASGEYASYDVNAGKGLELKISDAPAWDNGLESTLQVRTDNVLNELKGIQYTPSGLVMPGDPALDCGDMLELVTDDGSLITLVTEYKWAYHGRMSVTSKGVNPYLKAVEPQKSRDSRTLEKTTQAKKLIFYSFSNNEEVTTDSEAPVEIAQVTFVTTELTSAMFIAQLPLTVESEDYADVQVEYYINGTRVEYPLIQRCYAGPHVLSLLYTFAALPGNANYQWQVKLKLAGGAGKVTVPKRAFMATVTGQGMAGTGTWDGTLNIDESIRLPNLTIPLAVIPATEECVIATQDPVPAELEERVTRVGITSRFGLSGITGEVLLNPVWEKQELAAVELTPENYAERYVEIGERGAQLRTAWIYRSSEEPVDAGRMTVVKAVTGDLASVEEVTADES